MLAIGRVPDLRLGSEAKETPPVEKSAPVTIGWVADTGQRDDIGIEQGETLICGQREVNMEAAAANIAKMKQESKVLEDKALPVVPGLDTTPVKRGRGRPRIKPFGPFLPDKNKRGRGRPRKVPLAPGQTPPGPPKDPSVQELPKRGRGRPRKAPAKYEDAFQLEENRPKRGRGRPRKIPLDSGMDGKPKRGRGRPRKTAVDAEEDTPYKSARRTILSQIAKIRKEQWLLETYRMEGWRGASKEKIKPTSELNRAVESMKKAKLRISECMKVIDEAEGHKPIPKSVYTADGEIPEPEIFCGKCLSGDVQDDNDILLCDGVCGRAYHQHCVTPILQTDEIPPGDEGWLCPACDVKVDCMYHLNNLMNVSMPFSTPWNEIFPKQDETGIDCFDVLLDELYASPDPDGPKENTEKVADSNLKGDFLSMNLPSEEESDDKSFVPTTSSSSGSIKSYSNEKFDDSVEVDGEADGDHGAEEFEEFDESTSLHENSEEVEIVDGKRKRQKVDYKKLNEALFGGIEEYEGESMSDKEWSPQKLDESDRNMHLGSVKRERFPPEAVEVLRKIFAERQMPPMEEREDLAKALKLSRTQVNMWFASERHKHKRIAARTELAI